MAADLNGKSARRSIMANRHLREAQAFSLDDGPTSLMGSPKRMEKPVETAKAPAEIREYMDTGRRLNILGQSDPSFPRVSSALKCWDLFCNHTCRTRNSYVDPHFPNAELAILTWSSFLPAGRTFRMYLSHLVQLKGRQLNDCDATSRYAGRVKAAVKGQSKSKDCCIAARPVVSKDHLCRSVRASSSRHEFSLLVILGWIILLCVKSAALQMMRGAPPGNMPGTAQVNSHSVRGPVGGCLVLKLRRRRHMTPGSAPKRSCRRKVCDP